MSATTSTFKPRPFLSLQVQSVLYNLPPHKIERALAFLESAALYAKRQGAILDVRVSYGDCSPHRTFDDADITRLNERFPGLEGISYTYFDGNVGSAEGHNRLLRPASTDLIMIMNPDVLASPTVLTELSEALAVPDVGFVEARQLPIEHPKDYDRVTGETGWASTACAMGSRALFEELDGFDSATFFLYCDDVDFSWRARMSGRKVVYCNLATVYHDKRLSLDGGWISTPAEVYYSAEAALLLTYKYSRHDLTKRYLSEFRCSGSAMHEKAAAAFELRRSTGRLPTPIDHDHKIGEFIDGHYAHHRFVAR